MSKPSDYQSGAKSWRVALDEFWQDQLDADEADFDIELIAAYADGSLDDNQEAEAIAILARSPRALQCFLAIRDQWNEDHLAEQSPSVLLKAASTLTGSSEAPTRVKHESRNVGYPWIASPYIGSFALAASLLLVLFSGWSSWTNSIELASLRQQQTELNRAATLNDFLKQKEIALLLAAKRGPKYLSGTLTLGIVDTALLRFPISRGIAPQGGISTPAELAIMSNVSDHWKSSIAAAGEAIGEKQDQQIERAFAALVSGDLETAELMLESLKLKATTAPQVLNLQAVILLYRAESLVGQSSQSLVAEAESILKQVTQEHPDFALAWLNLALLAEYELQDTTAASVYRSRFLEQTDSAIRTGMKNRPE